MMDVKAFEQLREKVRRLETERAKAEGAWEQLMTRLKSDYGVESVEEAEELLDGLKKEQAVLEKRFAKMMEKLLKDFPELRDE